MQLLNDRSSSVPTPKILFYLKAIVKKVKIAEFHRTCALFRKLRCVRNQIKWLINEMKYREAFSSALKLNNSYTLLVSKCIWKHVRSLLFGTRLLVNTIAFFNFSVCPGESSYEKRIKIALRFQEIQEILFIRVIQFDVRNRKIDTKSKIIFQRTI